MTSYCVGWMGKHGDDWRTRLPLWRDTMNAAELMIMYMATLGESAIATPVVQDERLRDAAGKDSESGA